MERIRVEWFTATWCGPCKTVRPIVDELTAAGWNIEKIDVDKEHTRAAAANVMGVPAFLIYKDNVMVRRFSGAKPKVVFEQELRLALNSVIN